MRNDNYAEFERKDRNGCSLTLIVLKFIESNLVKYVLFMQLVSIILFFFKLMMLWENTHD